MHIKCYWELNLNISALILNVGGIPYDMYGNTWTVLFIIQTEWMVLKLTNEESFILWKYFVFHHSFLYILHWVILQLFEDHFLYDFCYLPIGLYISDRVHGITGITGGGSNIEFKCLHHEHFIWLSKTYLSVKHKIIVSYIFHSPRANL